MQESYIKALPFFLNESLSKQNDVQSGCSAVLNKTVIPVHFFQYEMGRFFKRSTVRACHLYLRSCVGFRARGTRAKGESLPLVLVKIDAYTFHFAQFGDAFSITSKLRQKIAMH